MSRADLRQILITPIALAIALIVLYVYVHGQVGGSGADTLAVQALTENTDAKTTGAYPHHVMVKLLEHLRLVGISAAFVLVIGIPLGIFVTRPGIRGAAPYVTAVASVGQAMPVIGLLVLVVVAVGKTPAWIAYAVLVVYSVLPILRNTIEGIRNIDPGLLDAARGQGLSNRQILRRVELPLAVPIILAGVRTSLILLVGTATLMTFINAGGLGDVINDGIKNQRPVVLLDGAILTLVLAVAVDWLAGLAERYLSPKGLQAGASA